MHRAEAFIDLNSTHISIWAGISWRI